MDFALMCRSADRSWNRLASSGAGRTGRSFEEALMPLGIAAERRMLAVTGGVNTHRGAIFSIGLIVAALARTVEAFGGHRAGHRSRDVLARYGGRPSSACSPRRTAASHGALVQRRTGRDGARREAALAFPSVFDVGIPAFGRR